MKSIYLDCVVGFNDDLHTITVKTNDNHQIVVEVEVDADGGSEGYTDCSMGHIVSIDGKEPAEQAKKDFEEIVEEAVSRYVTISSYECAFGKGSYPINK